MISTAYWYSIRFGLSELAGRPIIKTVRFSTLVPIVGAWTNSPIPMNTNIADPHHDFYSDLMGMANRPEKQPANWPQYKNRKLETEGGTFTVRLIQYYVFKSIYFLHRGSSGVRMTAGVGVAPIDRLPIVPPDTKPYPTERLLLLVSENEFFRPWDKMIWKYDNNRLQVPKDTQVSLIERPSIPNEGKPLVCTVRFERPSYYRVDFDVSSGMGANNSMPAGFTPQVIPGVITWAVTVTMHYEVQKRSDDGFQPELYSAWGDALFDGLRREMAFD